MTDAEVSELMKKRDDSSNAANLIAAVPAVRSTLLVVVLFMVHAYWIGDFMTMIDKEVSRTFATILGIADLVLWVVFWIWLLKKDVKLAAREERIKKENKELEEYQTLKAQSVREAELDEMRAWKKQQEGK